jgi:hypothetical protein
METETNKTEDNATGNKTTDAASEQANPQDMLAQLWKFANNPLIANAGLGAFLMWALDPKGMKAAIENMAQQMNAMTDKINDQSDTIRSLKKQVVRMRHTLAGEDENGKPDENLNGYGNAGKRKGSVFLD